MSDAHLDPAGTHDGDHGHGDIDAHVRKAFTVFGALLVLTGLTVGVSYLHLPALVAILAALLIATVKGGLVAAWFMHLASERKLVFAVLLLTVVLFFALLLLPYWTAGDVPALQSPASGAGRGAFSQDAAHPASAPAAH